MRSKSSTPDIDGDGQAALEDLIARFSACGATPGGGVTRLCASAADGAARDLFAAEIRAAGGELRVDAVGNQFGLFFLSGREGAPLVMMGSHLDSQVLAGRLDGTYGVAVAVRVGAALMQAWRGNAPFAADFCAVNWTNEEGARFRPSLLGSGTYLGRNGVADALALRDEDGTSLGTALAAIGYRGNDRPPPLPACYLEAHVEQGTVLEEAGFPIGIVTRNWGATKIEAVLTGVQAHTGPGRMETRRDALVAAASVITEIRGLADLWPGHLHTSVGRIRVAPNSANVVPARVELSVELRSADDAILAEAGARADRILEEAAAQAGTALAITGRTERPIRALPGAVVEWLASAAASANLRAMRMDTVAGHDALSFLGICPTGLVFVPSIGGIAHNEAEATAPADLAAGLRLMRLAAERLCRSGGDLHLIAQELSGGPA